MATSKKSKQRIDYEMQKKQLEALTDLPIVKSWHTQRLLKRDDWKTNKPSETMPNQSMTIMEIMQRYANGEPLTELDRQITYDSEYGKDPLNGRDFTKMDLAEQEEIMRANKLRIRQIRAEMAEQQKIAEETARQQKLAQELAKKSQEQQQTPTEQGGDSPNNP